jgi:uncharacterized protein (DUF1810 family)
MGSFLIRFGDSVSDYYNLDRFIQAQENTYKGIIEELRMGIKTGHWIWYIFPQISGLGSSEASQWYSISSLDEANAYLEHPILGPRLIQCTELVLAVEDKSAKQVFGLLDSLKLNSCMTLFAHASNNVVFKNVIEKYFGGKSDNLTIRALQSRTD